MPRKARKLASYETVKVRERFHEAISAGMSIAEASAYANGNKPQLDLLASKPAQPVSAPPIEPTWIDNGRQPSAFAEEAEPESKPEPAVSAQPELSAPAEKPASAEKKKVEIPANYAELPWGQLRSIAFKIGAQSVGSRAEAVSAIKAYLGK
jgi:hypothetical protein